MNPLPYTKNRIIQNPNKIEKIAVRTTTRYYPK